MVNMYYLYAYFAVLPIYVCLVGNGLINVFKQKHIQRLLYYEYKLYCVNTLNLI